jgi:hypothetical protein
LSAELPVRTIFWVVTNIADFKFLIPNRRFFVIALIARKWPLPSNKYPFQHRTLRKSRNKLGRRAEVVQADDLEFWQVRAFFNIQIFTADLKSTKLPTTPKRRGSQGGCWRSRRRALWPSQGEALLPASGDTYAADLDAAMRRAKVNPSNATRGRKSHPRKRQ